jgi:hypothetical protein
MPHPLSYITEVHNESKVKASQAALVCVCKICIIYLILFKECGTNIRAREIENIIAGKIESAKRVPYYKS